MSDSEPCCDLKLNPDITGIGVRAALYAQIMLGWVMSLYWPDTYVKNSRTAYMTATALLIASFIQLQTQDLSLLDGLVVSLITSMMITFAIASNPARHAQPNTSSPNANPQKQSVDSQKSVTRSFLQFCFVVFWGAWSWNLWKDPARFGLKGKNLNCTTNFDVTLSVFGREIHATDPRMRAAALSLVSIGFLIALCSMWFTLEQVMKPFISFMERNKQDNSQTPRKLYENPIVQGVHVFLQSMTIATLIYLTVSTEKTISKNDVKKETRDWTYGQTIALILLLQQVMDVFSTWIEKREEEEEEEDNDSDSDPGFQLPISNPKSQAAADPNQATTNQATTNQTTTDPNQAAANSDK